MIEPIEPFDPSNLHPRASLNRVRVLGPDVPAEVQGRSGIELVSARAWSAVIRQHGASLNLTTDEIALNDRELPRRFDHCLESQCPQVRRSAEALVRQFARYLGYILLTLKRGDASSRAARPDWDDTYWDAWQRVETVTFGGGLIWGNLAGPFSSELSGFCSAHRLYRTAIADAPWRAVMPMIGAARTVPPDSRFVIVFDFGCSFVKRGLAQYAHGVLAEFQPLPAIPARVDGSPQFVFDSMVGTIVSTWNELGAGRGSLSRTIPVSVAAYVRKGQPYDYQGGGYASIRQISDNAASALSQAVSSRLRVATTIQLLHDGTAAALVHAGEKNAAVIMLGTAMGIGFPASAEGLWKLAPAFSES